ncbi:MAG: RNA methyltransferase [Planctomycetes bacterium]|nr:RNA methyltransferase [Planctomycetota bacterium]
MFRFYAPCTLGLEPALAAELQALGATEVEPHAGGVGFAGDARLGLRANLWLRSAIRVQQEVLACAAPSTDAVYAAVRDLPWEGLLRLDQTLAVDAVVRDSAITHSQYLALRIKDAVVDRFRDRFGARPNIDPDDPDLPLRAVLRRDRLLLYRDWSGTSLHKRGWRPIQVKSPLNESIAAGLLLLAGWDRSGGLVDPMCGSGTLVVEAALLAADMAPGLRRRFACERFGDLEPGLMRALRAEAQARVRTKVDVSLEGADRHPGALAIARRGADAAGVGHLVRFVHAEVARYTPSFPPAYVFVNPPYGERIGEGEDLVQSWRDLGAFLRARCPGAQAYVLSGDPGLTRHLGLRSTQRWPVHNGPIECRLVRYDVRAAAAPEAPLP